MNEFLRKLPIINRLIDSNNGELQISKLASTGEPSDFCKSVTLVSRSLDDSNGFRDIMYLQWTDNFILALIHNIRGQRKSILERLSEDTKVSDIVNSLSIIISLTQYDRQIVDWYPELINDLKKQYGKNSSKFEEFTIEHNQMIVGLSEDLGFIREIKSDMI